MQTEQTMRAAPMIKRDIETLLKRLKQSRHIIGSLRRLFFFDVLTDHPPSQHALLSRCPLYLAARNLVLTNFRRSSSMPRWKIYGDFLRPPPLLHSHLTARVSSQIQEATSPMYFIRDLDRQPGLRKRLPEKRKHGDVSTLPRLTP